MPVAASALRKRITGNLTVGELVRRTWKEYRADEIATRAAVLAFYFTLAFFPMLIFLISLLSFFPGTREMILGYLDAVLPHEAAGVVQRWVGHVFSHGKGALSFSLVFTLWSASTGVVALIESFNKAYEVREGRPFWKTRLLAAGLTVGMALLILGGSLLFTFGALALEWLGDLLHLQKTLLVLSKAANYCIGLLMLFLGVALLHFFAPNLRQQWRFFTPGTLLTVLGILAASYLFSLYLRFAPSYSAVYGGLGAIVILMLWLYLVGLILLVGAEVNDEVRKSLGNEPHERERTELKTQRR